MPVSPNDFLQVAKKYFNTAVDEIEYRAAASRAYYSIYHACNDFYNSNKYTLIPSAVGAGMHAQLYSAFMSADKLRCGADTQNIRRIGIMANNMLKPLRKYADYDIATPFSPQKADLMIEKAKIVLDEVSKL